VILKPPTLDHRTVELLHLATEHTQRPGRPRRADPAMSGMLERCYSAAGSSPADAAGPASTAASSFCVVVKVNAPST